MASTSASSIQRSFKYDVFLSFRGKDTRKNFVDHLYHALHQRGIITYKDDVEITKGKRISDELIRSIENSRFYIIVFSKNYASSSWCLDELVKIMECQKTNENTAYPVFYDVEPTEVRKQSGAFGEAFSKHKEENEAIKKWRDALRQTADLAGWELKTTHDGHESKFIQKVVEEISLGLRFISSSVDGKLVGLETRLLHVASTLKIDIEDVRMIGIKGMGGSGKTTLARAVFDQISILFNGSSFVENVREISKSPLYGLKSLQKQVLSDVLNNNHINVNGVCEGKMMMKQKMRGRKVLVVLDDVDHVDQLKALACELNWFEKGSRVIITTRDEQVLVAHGVPKNLILDVNLLSHEEAGCLFSKYAFGREIPNQGYEMLSHQVVQYAAGLPLTIKVLGSFLCGKDELEWIDALERLKTIPLKETLEILELSYKGLEEDYKDIFLDVACLLKGWNKEHAIRALESCGFCARIGLRVLEQKSLITISENGRLGMHDHIEEMGKNIVRRLHPNEPCRHSRLWNQEEIEDILLEDEGRFTSSFKGTKAKGCIVKLFDSQTAMITGLQNMKELKFLDVTCRRELGFHPDFNDYEEGFRNDYSKYADYRDVDSHLHYDYIDEISGYLPNGLQYLRWDGYPFTCLPKKFHANNLVGLEIYYSKIDQLCKEEGNKVLKKLRFLDLTFCKLRTLDIRLNLNLERLHLENCWNLVELHMPAESCKLKFLNIRHVNLSTLDLAHAQNLEYLNLQCSKLKTLNLTQIHNLEKLDLACENLVELHMPVEHFKLKSINLCRSKIKTLHTGGAQCLEKLNIMNNNELVNLHLPVGKLKPLSLRCYKLRTLDLTRARNLEEIDLRKCECLQELHMPFESLELKHIYIYQSMLRTLNLMQTRNLEKLSLIECKNLEEVHMPIESPELKYIYFAFTSNLKILNLTQARKLEQLSLAECEDLEEVHMPIESAELEMIYIRNSYKLRTLNLKNTRNLESLSLHKCDNLQELHMPIEIPGLNSIYIASCKLRTLNVAGSQNLEILRLIDCEDLHELQMPIESLKLKSICIGFSKLRNLYLGLSPYLEVLDITKCFYLEEIHAPVGCLSGYVRFKPLLVDQELPMAGSLAELHLIVTSLSICSLHPDNNLPKFHFECIYKELVLSSTQNLVELMYFSPCACTNLASLLGVIFRLQLKKLTLEGSILEVLKEIDQLECLEELTLLSTDIKHLPSSICKLKHLKVLHIKSCKFLEQLPEDLGKLECLEELRLTNCVSLRDIPNSIGEMKGLKCFHLINCSRVENLPKEIGRLKCLKELKIQGTRIRDIPESLYELEDLVFLF